MVHKSAPVLLLNVLNLMTLHLLGFKAILLFWDQDVIILLNLRFPFSLCHRPRNVLLIPTCASAGADPGYVKRGGGGRDPRRGGGRVADTTRK